MVITVNAGGRSGKVKSRVGQHYYNVVAHKRHSYLDSIDRCLVDCSCGVPEVSLPPPDPHSHSHSQRAGALTLTPLPA